MIETNEQYHKQLVSLEVFRTRGLFKSDKVVASGYFSVSPQSLHNLMAANLHAQLLGNVGKPFSVNLSTLKGTGSAVLKAQLIRM